MLKKNQNPFSKKILSLYKILLDYKSIVLGISGGYLNGFLWHIRQIKGSFYRKNPLLNCLSPDISRTEFATSGNSKSNSTNSDYRVTNKTIYIIMKYPG